MIAEIPGIEGYVTAIRREIHENPGVEFDLENTCSIVRRELKKIGLRIWEDYGKSSIVAVINGKYPGKMIALRADMDALPIKEENDIPYKSKHDGLMHACGHDGHTAMLLAAAKVINSSKEQLKGSVKLIFQASEEGPESGAKLMVEDGVVDDVDNIVALHLTNEFPIGMVCANIGRAMASALKFDMEIVGKGGHAGAPDKAVDAIALGVKVINSVYYIVSREISPFEPVVINIGSIHGGTASNAIAERIIISGTVRTYSLVIQDLIKEKFKTILEGTVGLAGGKYTLKFNAGIPPLINDEEKVGEFSKSIKKVTGEENFRILENGKMGGEDFVYYLQKTKGCIVWLGAGNEVEGKINDLHNPKFDFDENALAIGTEILVQYTLDQLSN